MEARWTAVIDGNRRRASTLALAVLLAVVVVVPTEVRVGPAADSAGSAGLAVQLTPYQLGFLSHIKHIVFVVMENHAYDNLFGTYCQVKTTICPLIPNGIPPGTCVPKNPLNPTGPCVRPWNFTTANWTVPDMLHFWAQAHEAWNNGSMNGFYRAEHSGCAPCGIGLNPFGHYNGSSVPIYWDLAQEYTLNDNFYSSLLDYSLPNHWHIVAGQAPAVILQNITYPNPNSTVNVSHYIQLDHTYLNQSNRTKSIEDLLINSTVPWKYYDFKLGSYAHAIQIAANANHTRIVGVGGAYKLWNPQAAKAESYNASFTSHFVDNTQFYGDARNGTLPSISWVMPTGMESDHPPYRSNVAQQFLASIVNAMESSPEWNSSVMYITWDDYGGFYDHVAPPTSYGAQLGFRVPLLIVSPYVKSGNVVSSRGYLESILHGMEWRFGLGCLGPMDCNAPLPLYGFNWTNPPRAPLLFPTNISLATYPYNPNWNGGALATPYGGYYPPDPFGNLAALGDPAPD